MYLNKAENKNISSRKDTEIVLENCANIRIFNNFVANGNYKNGGIYIYNCRNVLIYNNDIINVLSGVIASLSTGVYIGYNRFKNMIGPPNMGQFVQFRECYGSGNRIVGNNMINEFGKSNPEDAISIYRSHGVPYSWITVEDNYINGGGPSKTGGGINLGDGKKADETGPADTGSYQIALNNTLINPGQYAIAISGGHDMALVANNIYAKKQAFTNVGVIAANWYNDKVYNYDVRDNKVYFDSGIYNQLNPYWFGVPVNESGNVWNDLSLKK